MSYSKAKKALCSFHAVSLDGGGAAEPPVKHRWLSLTFSNFVLPRMGAVRPASQANWLSFSSLEAGRPGGWTRSSLGAPAATRRAGRPALVASDTRDGRGPQAPRPIFISRTHQHIIRALPGRMLGSLHAKCHHIATNGHHCTVARWIEVRVRRLRGKAGDFPQCFDCGGPEGVPGRTGLPQNPARGPRTGFSGTSGAGAPFPCACPSEVGFGFAIQGPEESECPLPLRCSHTRGRAFAVQVLPRKGACLNGGQSWAL